MANEFLFGVPGKLKDIYDYLTNTVWPELDAKATSTEVAKASVCTETRLSKLDATVSSAKPLKYVTTSIITSGSSWTVPSDLVGDMIWVSGCGGGGGGGGLTIESGSAGQSSSGSAGVSGVLVPLPLNGATSLSITIGTGGSGGSGSSNGGYGGYTRIGVGASSNYLVFHGGTGGKSVTDSNAEMYVTSPLKRRLNAYNTGYYTDSLSTAQPFPPALPLIDGGAGSRYGADNAINGTGIDNNPISKGYGGNSFFGSGGAYGYETSGSNGSGYGSGGGSVIADSITPLWARSGGNGAPGFLQITYLAYV